MSYSRKAILLGILCSLFCIIYETVLSDIPAANKFIYALGYVANCVSLSVIASCIFYIVTDYLPKKQQKKVINSYLMILFSTLNLIGKNAFLDISNMENPTKENFLKKSDINLLNRIINTKQQESIIKKSSNWFDYFKNLYLVESLVVEKILNFESFIPVKVRLKIIELQKKDTIFSSTQKKEDQYSSNTRNRTISAYGNEIYNHLSILVELIDIYKENSKI